ncbi:MAG: motility associated factor glycosyltransferase family protein [Brevinematia bacterium]
MILNNLKLSEDIKRKLYNHGSLKNVEFLVSKSGVETIKKNNILIHSLYDPIKEAEVIVSQLNIRDTSNYLFVLLGVGLGYHLKILKERYPGSVILPIEIDDDIALAFIQKNDDFIVTNFNFNDIYTILNFVDFAVIKDIKFVYLSSVYRIYKDRYDRIVDNIKKIVESKFTDLLTRINFDKLWVKNALLNLPYVLKYGSLTENVVRNSFKNFLGKPFVVLGAGYSAKFLLDVLRKYREKYVLCVVDTALKSLLCYGISPDFVFSLDSQFANLKDFFGVRSDDFTLLADIVVSPELIRNFKGKVFITKSSHVEVLGGIVYEMTNSVVSWLENIMGYSLLGLESGGSVSTNLFHFALLMGGDPVFLIGVDLGFPYLVSHIQGSPSHEYFTISGNVFKTGDSYFVSSILRDYILLKGIKNNECVSHKVMETYKVWFDSASDTSNLKNVYNISDGVEIKGIVNMTTYEGEKFLSSVLSNKLNLDRKINISYDVHSVNVNQVYYRLSNLKKDVIDVVNNFSKNSVDMIIKSYPFVLNVLSKSLFGFFRGQKDFLECKEDIILDLKYLVKVLNNIGIT